MGFWLSMNMAKILPFLARTTIWYRIKDAKGLWHSDIINLKKGTNNFKWRKFEYNVTGTPEFDNSLKIRYYEYVWNCPYPLSINPDDPDFVKFRETAKTTAISNANLEMQAYHKAMLMKKKEEMNTLLIILGAIALSTIIIMYQLSGILDKLPK